MDNKRIIRQVINFTCLIFLIININREIFNGYRLNG
nr:MAG TPA: ATP synthase [Bacteriophage sp.]